MSDYPEHDKMEAAHGDAQVIGTFLEWLTDGRGLVLGRWSEDRPRLAVRIDPETLMYEYFDIDRSKIEAEKNQMLEALRAANERARAGVVESRNAQPTNLD